MRENQTTLKKKIGSGIITISLLVPLASPIISFDPLPVRAAQEAEIESVAYKRDETLKNLTLLAEGLLNEVEPGTGAGQYPQEAITAFQLEVEKLTSYNGSNQEQIAYELIDAGNTLLNTVVTSDRIVNEETKELEYSVYRKELNQLVWEAKATLMVEPDQYTEAAKIALADQISKAESVLNGSYEVPFVRNREFIQVRTDENIRFAIEHYSKAPSYGMSTYGLKPALQWYKNQHILLNSYQQMSISPEEDTFVQSSSASSNFGTKQTAIVSNGRIVFMKFDLSQVEGTIKKAELQITNHKNDNNLLMAHHEADDSWTESGLTYNSLPKVNNQPKLGPVIGQWLMGGRGNRSAVQVTTAAAYEQTKDGRLTLSITQDPNARFPGEFYTKEAENEEQRPALLVTTNKVDPEKIEVFHNKVTKLAEELVAGAEAGENVGQYSEEAIEGVKAAVTKAEQVKGEGEIHGAALVRVYDAMRTMRESQVLRTDVEPESSLFFTEESLQELKNEIETNDVLKEEFNKLKEKSDSMTLEEIKGLSRLLEKNVDWDEVNIEYKIWTNVKNQNFTPPANAVSASLKITLPSIENEADGLGHVWIDNLRVYASNGGDLSIENPSFESGSTSPEHWAAVTEKGAPLLNWEDRKNYTSAGAKSLYLENPTSEDQGSWVYEKEIPLTGGIGHSITYDVKNDGVLKEGINLVFTFKDKDGNKVGEYINKNNHKSDFGFSDFNLTFQTDALVYAVTGNREYAEKAKERMLWFLNDHLQGNESWFVNNARPFGNDAYGAVQEGRNASSLAAAYSLIKHAGVFSEEEKKNLMSKVDYWMHGLTDLRDRTELGLLDAQKNTGNWETDMSAGAAYLAMAFGDELPNSRQWLDNGKIVIDGQLTYTLREDGGWPESIRYHFSTLERVSSFAKALRNVTGENWFNDHVLKNMFSFLVEVQTPEYEYLDGHISTPNFGDHTLDNGVQYSTLGLFADEFESSDPQLASNMRQTWERAGKPLKGYGGEANAFENFFSSGEPEETADTLKLTSTDAIQSWGMNIFRNYFNTEKETFLAQATSEKALGHAHYDQGSFILYSHNTPLVMDPGIESYFDASKSWYVGSSSHSTVQFKSGGAYKDTPLTSSQEEFFTSSALDYSRVKIAHPSGESAGTHTRNIAYVKEGIDAFVIWDQMKNNQEGTRFNLPVAATGSTINGNKAESIGHFSMDLETTALQPASAAIKQEFARAHPSSVPSIDGNHQLNYLRIEAAQGENFLTVLYPKQKGAEGLTTEKIETTNGQVDAYRITDPSGQWFIAAVNNSDTDQKVLVSGGEHLIDLKEGTSFKAENGQTMISVKPNSIHLFNANSIHSIEQRVAQYVKNGDLKEPLAGLLNNKLKQADHHTEKGQPEQAVKQLEDFIKHANNSSHKEKITEAARVSLIQKVKALIDVMK